MDVKKLATEYHEKGFNCAQSVLCSCGEYTGLDEKTALAVSGGFAAACAAVKSAVRFPAQLWRRACAASMLIILTLKPRPRLPSLQNISPVSSRKNTAYFAVLT